VICFAVVLACTTTTARRFASQSEASLSAEFIIADLVAAHNFAERARRLLPFSLSAAVICARVVCECSQQ